VATAIANAQARVELRRFGEEQAAQRRVAMLVAGGAPPKAVFAAVAEQIGTILQVHHTAVCRYDPDSGIMVVGAWAAAGVRLPVPVGRRMALGGRNVGTLVMQTGRPARIDELADDVGPDLADAVARGVRSGVGAPIRVDGHLWGFVVVAARAPEALPQDTEERLTGFTELVGTAIANAEVQAQLTASRARIVAAGDATPRRIERDCTTVPSNAWSHWLSSCAARHPRCRLEPTTSPPSWPACAPGSPARSRSCARSPGASTPRPSQRAG
jgi:GAF domain-containing protein